jgi:hypothetical protein
MSSPRPGVSGASRECPHCKEVILASASVCPACRHHLRFDPSAIASADVAAITALRVDASIGPPPDAPAWEYSVVVAVRNERGEEVSRRVVSVGAIGAGEQRAFSLSVEASPARPKGAPRGGRF